MGGFVSQEDGAVTVDSNVGTADELKAEIATETAKPRGTGKAAPDAPASGRQAAAAVPAAADGTPAVGDDDDEGVQPEAGAVAKPVAPTKKPKGSYQKRLDAITAQQYATERERDEARAEVARLKQAAKPTAFGGVEVKAEKFPKLAEYLALPGNEAKELEDWVDDRDAWKDAKATAAVDARTATETATQSARSEHSETFAPKAATYYERIKPTLDADPEFYTKVDPRLTETPAMSALPPGTKPTFGNFLVEQVINSPCPAALLVHLSEKATIRRLMTLQPDQVIRSIHEFELEHGPSSAESTGPDDDEQNDDDEGEQPPARVPAPRSQASPPVKPVRGSSQQSAGEEPDDEASDDEWYRSERAKQDRKRRAAAAH